MPQNHLKVEDQDVKQDTDGQEGAGQEGAGQEGAE